MAVITSSVVKITFKMDVIISSVAKITFVVAEITFEVDVITSTVTKIKCVFIALVKHIAVVLVSSKLDYCSSLFHNIPEKNRNSLEYSVFRTALLE